MRNARYTKEELKNLFLKAEKKLGRAPKVIEFGEVGGIGLPEFGYYSRNYQNYANFLTALGRIAPQRKYNKKINPKRFFFPMEWLNMINRIIDDDHKFWLELLLHTGMRIKEARGVKVRDIDFNRSNIFITKPKGGRGKERTVMISNYFRNRLQNYISKNKLVSDDTLGLPTTQYMDEMIKKYAKESGIKDFNEFSAHNIRKTIETYLITTGKDSTLVSLWIGHKIDIAMAHYISSVMFTITNNERVVINSIIDNLLDLNIGGQNQNQQVR
jgi:integrase